MNVKRDIRSDSQRLREDSRELRARAASLLSELNTLGKKQASERAAFKWDRRQWQNREQNLQQSLEEETRFRGAMLFMLEDLEENRRALERVHREWLAVVDTIRDPIMVHDADMRILRVNQAYAERVGLAYNRIIGRPYWECFPRRDGPLPACRHAVSADAAGPEKVIDEFTLDTGEIFISRVFTSYDDQGRFEYGLHVFEDVTERRRARLQIEASEAKFRALVETSSDWIWETDPAGCYTYASPKVKELLGYEPGELLGRAAFELMPPAEACRIGELFAEIAAQKRSFAALKNTSLHRDGREVVLETSGVPILDARGELLGYRGVDRDITERERNGEILRVSQERLALATRSAQIGVWDWDIAANRLLWDRRMYELYGIREQDFHRTYEAWRDGLHPDDIASSDAAVADALAGRKDFEHQFRIYWPGGEMRYLEGHAVVLRATDGTPTRMIGVNRDITARKLAEQAIARQLEELKRWHVATLGREDRVIELKREVNQLLAQLGEPVRYRGAEEAHQTEALP